MSRCAVVVCTTLVWASLLAAPFVGCTYLADEVHTTWENGYHSHPSPVGWAYLSVLFLLSLFLLATSCMWAAASLRDRRHRARTDGGDAVGIFVVAPSRTGSASSGSSSTSSGGSSVPRRRVRRVSVDVEAPPPEPLSPWREGTFVEPSTVVRVRGAVVRRPSLVAMVGELHGTPLTAYEEASMRIVATCTESASDTSDPDDAIEYAHGSLLRVERAHARHVRTAAAERRAGTPLERRRRRLSMTLDGVPSGDGNGGLRGRRNSVPWDV